MHSGGLERCDQRPHAAERVCSPVPPPAVKFCCLAFADLPYSPISTSSFHFLFLETCAPMGCRPPSGPRVHNLRAPDHVCSKPDGGGDYSAIDRESSARVTLCVLPYKLPGRWIPLRIRQGEVIRVNSTRTCNTVEPTWYTLPPKTKTLEGSPGVLDRTVGDINEGCVGEPLRTSASAFLGDAFGECLDCEGRGNMTG